MFFNILYKTGLLVINFLFLFVRKRNYFPFIFEGHFDEFRILDWQRFFVLFFTFNTIKVLFDYLFAYVASDKKFSVVLFLVLL